MASAQELPPQAATVHFISTELGPPGKTVTGVPYSGEGFTERVETLADGTRITQKHSKKVWRDGQGRTRDESTPPLPGPGAAQGDAPKLTTIVDPVAKVIYTLNEKDRTAFRRRMPDFAAMATKAGAEGKNIVYRSREERTITVTGGPARTEDVLIGAPPGAAAGIIAGIRALGADARQEESLGTQIMEGLKVEGKRLTRTIKAGEIGNDRDLVNVTERWTSPELQALIGMTVKDPRMGETTYRLTNIVRTEPAASLFQVPADYTFTDAPEHFLFEGTIQAK